MKTTIRSFAVLALLASGACTGDKQPDTKQKVDAVQDAPPTAEEAEAFAGRVNADLKEKWTDSARAAWVAATYITDDTEQLAADANEDVMAYTAAAIQDATAFDGLTLDPATARQLHLLKVSSSLPAPSDDAKRSELAQIAAKMESMYGKGKYCPPGIEEGSEGCQDLAELSRLIREGKTYEEKEQAWKGWRTISVPMRPLYQRYVELGNEGAREIGFTDMSHLWKSRYDMPPEQFEATVEKLWQQVRPLYEDLHCYARSKLAAQYQGKVDEKGAIPAHLLGNMWAQEWANLYPLLEPYPGKTSLDVTKALNDKGYDAKRMVKLGESFFTGIGLDALPDSFYERSQFLQPRDRDVVCHASAWDVTYEKDVRIKMCIKVDEEDLITIHHELGHIYYYMYYYNLPVLFQDGAHDGFHEAIGDALALSVTPGYLKQQGILDEVPKDDQGLLNVQMKVALDKIAFLPFGRMIDQWRWDVFSGKVPPTSYNQHWWKLREAYQGVKAPEARGDEYFDPGAKYHIPANVPYVRYFLSFIMQFQFHQAMCQAAGHEGPLHTCSIAGSTAAGDKLRNMLALGSSKPWPDALEAMTGTREMDASAILEYFAPLAAWLKQQNEGKTCGW